MESRHDYLMGYRVEVIDPDNPEFIAAERLEYDIFRAEGFCMGSDTGRAVEYDRWRVASRFHVVIDDTGATVGCVRTLDGRYEDLPIGHFERTDAEPGDPVCEYASLAVEPDSRSRGAAEALYRSVWIEARRSNMNGLVAVVERWLLELLHDHYGFAFTQLGPEEFYMGGLCLPVGVPFERLESQLQSDRPGLWRYLIEPLTDDERQAWAL